MVFEELQHRYRTMLVDLFHADFCLPSILEIKEDPELLCLVVSFHGIDFRDVTRPVARIGQPVSEILGGTVALEPLCGCWRASRAFLERSRRLPLQ